MNVIHENKSVKKVFIQPHPTKSNKKIKKLIDKCLEFIYAFSTSQIEWSVIEENYKNEIMTVKKNTEVDAKVIIDYCLIFGSQIAPELREDFLYYIEEFCPKLMDGYEGDYGNTKEEIFDKLRKEM